MARGAQAEQAAGVAHLRRSLVLCLLLGGLPLWAHDLWPTDPTGKDSHSQARLSVPTHARLPPGTRCHVVVTGFGYCIVEGARGPLLMGRCSPGLRLPSLCQAGSF